METAKIIESSTNNSQIQENKKAQENPQIYSTVFKDHITSVSRPNKQVNISLTPHPRDQSIDFNSDGIKLSNEKDLKSLVKNEVSVEYSKLSENFDKNYEQPIIKHKIDENEPSFLEKNLSKTEKSNDFLIINRTNEQEINDGIVYFTSQLSNAKLMSEKVKIVISGRERLIKEAKDLRQSLTKDINELIGSKALALRANNLMKYYENVLLSEQENKRLRLGDELGIRESLKNKLIREVQGIRTPKYLYRDVDEINPDDLAKITQQVISALTVK